MGKKRKELSHEEIWDDSALVNSWNAAYEEYKYYHSLHARGEKVQDVLDAYDREDFGSQVAETFGNGAATGPPKENSSSEDGEIAEGGDENEEHQNHETSREQTAANPEYPILEQSQDVVQPQMPGDLVNGSSTQEFDDVLVLGRLLHWAT